MVCGHLVIKLNMTILLVNVMLVKMHVLSL
ncbi:MAG: hypothetical protein ACD_72C00240G0001 [uncultured bacterium]|nr:MAG: hypothetical protein ACD_72C00240G0001 [uncultured bacterium]